MKIVHYIFVVLCALAFQVIAADSETQPLTQQMLAKIDKVEWQLERVLDNGKEKAFPQKKPVTIRLEESGKVGGGAPINRYFGQMELKADGVIVWSGPGFGATMMAGPPELMDLEQYYFKSLQKCNRVSINTGKLIFHTEDNAVRFEYKKK